MLRQLLTLVSDEESLNISGAHCEYVRVRSAATCVSTFGARISFLFVTVPSDI